MVNNLIRAHYSIMKTICLELIYNIIIKTTVASGGNLPVP